MALALDDSLARKLILIEDVERVFNQLARRGRDGCGLMRRLANLRYTWEDFTKRPQFVIAQLREAIES